MTFILRGAVQLPFSGDDFLAAARYDNWIHDIAQERYDSDLANEALSFASESINFGDSNSEMYIRDLKQNLDPQNFLNGLYSHTQNTLLGINSFFIPGCMTFNTLSFLSKQDRKNIFEPFVSAHQQQYMPIFEDIFNVHHTRNPCKCSDQDIARIFRKNYHTLEEYQEKQKTLVEHFSKIDGIYNQIIEKKGDAIRATHIMRKTVLDAKYLINQSIFAPVFR